MKRDQDKTREQLISELAGLRQRVAELETLETERKQAEEKLREETEKLQALMNGLTSTGIAIDIVSNDYKILLQNQVLVERFGDCAGKICYEEYMELEAPCDICPMREAIKNNRVESVELTGADGRSYEVFSAPLPNPDGSVDRAIEVIMDITERNQVAKELQESGKRYRLLADNAADAICIVDMNMRPTYINPSVTRLLGYSVEEAMTKTPEEVFTPTSFKVVMKALAEELATEKMEQKDLFRSRVLELELNRKDGSIVPVEIGCSFLRDADAQPVEVLAIARDITGRKKMEEALRENEEKLQRMFESATDGIVVTDLNGNIIEVNEAAVRLYGSDSKEKLIGRSAFEFIAEKDRVQVMEALKSALEDGQIRRNVEITFLTEDGREYFAEVSSALLKDASGNPVGFIAITRDITERKQVEERTEQIQEYLQLQVNRMPIGLIVWDAEFRVQTWNPAAEKIFGFTAEEALGKHSYDIIVPKEVQPHVDDIWHRLLEGDVTAHSINENITKDGRTIICDWSNTPLRKADGTTPGVLSMVQDITERKQVEEALRESERRYRLLAENAEDVIWTVDMNMRPTYMSPSITCLLGYSVEEAMTLPMEAVYAPASFETAMKVLAEELAIENMEQKDLSRSRTLELELNRKDGSIVPVEVKFSFIREPDGRPVKILAIARDITERKRAEEALRESEQKYRALFENLNDAAFLADTETGRILDTNKQGEVLVGRTREKIIGMHQTELHPPGMANQYRQRFATHVQQGRVADYDGEAVRKDGSIVPVNISAAPVTIGEKQLILGLFRDITERKQAEAELKESKEKLKTIVENIRDVVFQLSPLGIIQYVSPKVQEVYGYKPEDLIGKSLQKTTPTSELPKALEALKSVLSGKLINNFEINQLAADGKIIPMEINATPVRKDGKIIAMQGIMRDITERKRAEEQIKQTAEEWRRTFDSITDLVSIHDKDFRFIRVNKAFTEAFEMEPKELAGKSCHEIVHRTNEPWPNCPHKRTLEDGKPHMAEFFEPHLGIHLEVSASPIFNEKGEVIACVHVARDITERKQAEEKAREVETLKELDRLRSGLLANVSHELRTPLTSIKGFATTLLRSDVQWSEEDQRDFLQSIDQETERLIRLINDLLDMSRIEAGGLKLDKHNYQIADILNSVNSRLASLTEHHQLWVIVPSELPPVFVDEMHIGQVLTNLVENATKYSSEGSPITIEAQLAGNQIIISVTDRGEGIPAELRDKVFDHLYQAESIVTGRKSGTGLGLSICRGILEAHGGRIWVESKVGKGSKFSFNLPTSEREEQVA